MAFPTATLTALKARANKNVIEGRPAVDAALISELIQALLDDPYEPAA
jgi:hypothetical protein